jgi:hypothetical protein
VEVSKMPWLILAVVGVLGFHMFSCWKGAKSLPDLSDDEFVARFSRSYSAKPEQVIEARKRIARILGVPADKLAPEHTYKYLSQLFDTLGNFSVAWSDLEYEVQEIARTPKPSPEEYPSTVGDLVAGLVQAKRVDSPAAPGGKRDL